MPARSWKLTPVLPLDAMRFDFVRSRPRSKRGLRVCGDKNGRCPTEADRCRKNCRAAKGCEGTGRGGGAPRQLIKDDSNEATDLALLGDHAGGCGRLRPDRRRLLRIPAPTESYATTILGEGLTVSLDSKTVTRSPLVRSPKRSTRPMYGRIPTGSSCTHRIGRLECRETT